MASGNIEAFLRDTLAPILKARAQPDPSAPYLAVDECMNNRAVEALARRLVAAGSVSGAGPVWVEMRQKADGERLTVLGGVPRRGERHFDYGAPVKGWSWSDRRVVEFLVAHFTSNDRIVLLTENVRWDHEGLRRILRTEVEPALLSYGIGRLGLLVLFKRGKANYDSYCSAVVRYLRVNVVCPGLTEVELPTD